MVRVEVLAVGMFQSNSFVVSCEKTGEAIVVDAGDEGGRIARRAADAGLSVKMIVCTHGHIDHVAGLHELTSIVKVPVAMHKDEIALYEKVEQQAALFGLPAPKKVRIERLLSDGDTIEFGEITGRVAHAPGHSPGGICLVFEKENPPVVFVGDVLFSGSIGRTDLMGASSRRMADTLRTVILALPDDCIVYSGHGPETTVGEERRSNPFLLDFDAWS